jgi:hypothetical protein
MPNLDQTVTVQFIPFASTNLRLIEFAPVAHAAGSKAPIAVRLVDRTTAVTEIVSLPEPYLRLTL